MKRVLFGLLVLTFAASPSWAAGLKLTIRDGKVSLDAQDVTVRQILTEWARVGKTLIINLEQVTSAPMTLQFNGVPEEQALDIILRSVPGYMAAPRAVIAPDASIYDRILIMATTVAVAPRPQSPASQAPFPPFPRPSPNVTQLRATPGPITPGLLPEPADDDDGPDMNDPAIAAAAAAGLIALPAPGPGGMTIGPAGIARPPTRTSTTTTPPVSSAPTPVWTAPAGTAQPSLPTPVLASPNRPASIPPPQEDR